MQTRAIIANLSAYGLSHALVDFCCAGLAMSAIRAHSLGNADVVALLLAYNFLAFAMQAPLGVLLDKIKTPRAFALAGILMQIAALALSLFAPPLAVIAVAGAGNAVFHLGGGVISMNIEPGRAAYPGVFVAPGAVGLFLGGWLGNAGAFPIAATALALGVMGVAVMKADLGAPPQTPQGSRAPLTPVTRSKATFSFVRAAPSQKKFDLDFFMTGVKGTVSPCGFGRSPRSAFITAAAACMIFVSIAIRSLVGLSVSFPWRGDGFAYALAFAVASGGGKAIGGFAADRFGFVRTCVVALAASIPLFAYGVGNPLLGLAGCVAFQMTMSVTLVAYARLFGGRDGAAFGLACCALFAGALPVLLPFPNAFDALARVAESAPYVAIIVSIVCLSVGLKICLSTSAIIFPRLRSPSRSNTR